MFSRYGNIWYRRIDKSRRWKTKLVETTYDSKRNDSDNFPPVARNEPTLDFRYNNGTNELINEHGCLVKVQHCRLFRIYNSHYSRAALSRVIHAYLRLRSLCLSLSLSLPLAIAVTMTFPFSINPLMAAWNIFPSKIRYSDCYLFACSVNAMGAQRDGIVSLCFYRV